MFALLCFAVGGQFAYKFNVVLTTYEFVGKDKQMLQSVPWQYLVVDEAHRLKDDSSQLYQVSQRYKFNVVLTRPALTCC